MTKKIIDHINDWMFDNARNSWDIDANKVLWWFNKYYHEIEEEVATFIVDWYFDKDTTVNLVNWTDTYTISDLSKVLEVSVKYKSNMPYVLAREYPDWDMRRPQDTFSAHTSIWTPMFKVVWLNQIKVFPTPTEDCTAWLKVRYSSTYTDVEANDYETALSLPVIAIPVILEWCTWQNAKTCRDPNVLMYKQDYEEEKNKLFTWLSDRYVQPANYRNPNLKWLMN